MKVFGILIFPHVCERVSNGNADNNPDRGQGRQGESAIFTELYNMTREFNLQMPHLFEKFFPLFSFHLIWIKSDSLK